MSKNGKTPYIGVDLGGTKILAALIDADGDVIKQVKNRTPAAEGPDAVIDAIIATVKDLRDKTGVSRKEIGAVGVGAPGVVDVRKGVVRFAPNLSLWQEVPLAQRLEQGIKLPVVVGNDVDVATYGEYALGAAKGVDSLVGIFPGTGIGGAVILDGKLHTGARGSANEIGHMVLVANGPVCGCGRQGCAEAVASRTAIERDLTAAMRFGRETILTTLVEPGERIRSGALAKAARAGDDLVLEVLNRTAYYLGLLTGSLVNFIDPEMIVFGGGLMEACHEWMLPTITVVARQHFINPLDKEQVQIALASLGDHAGVLGAAMLARATFG